MNRRQMMKAFPTLVAASACAQAATVQAQAVSPQTPNTPPLYKGRLRPGVIAFSLRPKLESGKMTYEDIVRFIADLGLEGLEMTGYWLPPMLNFPPARRRPKSPRWCGRRLRIHRSSGCDRCGRRRTERRDMSTVWDRR